MPRLVGVNIPDEKQIRIALTYIYGIGPFSAYEILRQADINPEKKAKDLTADEKRKIKAIVEKNHKIEGELKRVKKEDIKRLERIGSWRGDRHKKGLPARGQTTRVNSRTVRGNVRKTMGSGRKPPPAAK